MSLSKVIGLGFGVLLVSAWVGHSEAQQPAPVGGAPTAGAGAQARG